MDQSLPNQQQEPLQQIPQPGKKGLVKALGILEVGLIELLLVCIVIILLFGTLNYFNILRLSEIFPNYLGFLPHRQQSNNLTIKQFNNVDVTIAPTISPISPSTQGNLSSQAKQTLVEFLPIILNPSVIPQSSDVSVVHEGIIEKQRFRSSWGTKDGTASALFVVDQNNLKIHRFEVLLPFTTSNIASIAIGQETIPQFLSVKPKGTWGCKPLYNNNTYCESFWEEEDGVKQGVGIVEALFGNAKTKVLLIVFCERSQQSSIYSWKSCDAEFAKTGVQ